MGILLLLHRVAQTLRKHNTMIALKLQGKSQTFSLISGVSAFYTKGDGDGWGVIWQKALDLHSVAETP
jgi:hypothetical protein